MLDVRTLLAALAAGFLLMAFMGAYLSHLHRGEKAIRYWAAGCLIIAISDMLFFFRPVLPGFLTIIVGNATTVAGGYLLYSGIAAFDGFPKRLYLGAILTVAATVLIAYFTYVDPDIRARIVISTAALLFVMVMMAVHLLRPGIREHQLLRRILGILFCGLAVLSAVRIGQVIIHADNPDMSIFSNSPVAAAWLMGVLSVTFLSSLDFLLMPGQRMQMQLDQLARLDELTGLLNRRAFNRRLEDAPDAGGCVMLLDVDRFKRLNDQYGHAAGDAVLRAFAECVTSQLRREDVFARYGGDEFSVLLPGTDLAQAAVVAERIRTAVERLEVRFGDLVLKVTASIGAAPLEPGKLDLSLASADVALYGAKSRGRNRVEMGGTAGAVSVQAGT
jgi:diguanylate cyclase (GGDEF)-like protein